jgi:hypothetical protein
MFSRFPAAVSFYVKSGGRLQQPLRQISRHGPREVCNFRRRRRIVCRFYVFVLAACKTKQCKESLLIRMLKLAHHHGESSIASI